MQTVPTIPAKTIVTRTKNAAWFGADYNMNIYRGCTHGCIYCDSRSECYGNDRFDTVFVKQDALAIIRRELAGKRRHGVVSAGSMSDPYNPLEKQLELTRGALQLLAQYGFGVSIATKGSLVTRDIDILQEIAANAPVLVKVTITAADDLLAKKIEPHAPSAALRFDALAKLSAAGIFCGVLLMPVLPFITDTDENIRAIARRTADAGARFIYPGLGVTLRDRQRAYFYERLDGLFPGLSARYHRQYGMQYSCGSPRANDLHAVLTEECHARGLLYRMQDITAGYRGTFEPEQLMLFQ